MTEEDWDAVLDINLKGTFLFTKAVARIMMKQRSGAIVNIASIIGLIGNAGQCNYAASKAGVIALTKSVAKELGGRGDPRQRGGARVHSDHDDGQAARGRFEGRCWRASRPASSGRRRMWRMWCSFWPATRPRT